MDWRRRVEQRMGFGLARVPRVNTLPWMLRRVFDEYRTDCVIDVGANVGQFANSLRTELRFSGRIASVEPAPDSFAALTANMAGDPNWSGHQLALGEQPGELPLMRYGGSDNDSLLPPSDFGRARHGFADGDIVAVVPIRTLADAWPELVGPSRSVFLKTDTQGLDLAVVRSAGERLAEARGLVMEVQSKPTYDGAPALPEVIREVNALGFDEVGFFPVTRIKGGLALVTCDVIFVRR